MTHDEIIEMAKQAGIEEAYSLKHNQYLVRFKDGSLEVFAKLVAEAEREACAKILDANAMACRTPVMRSLLQSNAQAIRARGQA
jgi:hypothetical protein